jgi:hypothetical protein
MFPGGNFTPLDRQSSGYTSAWTGFPPARVSTIPSSIPLSIPAGTSQRSFGAACRSHDFNSSRAFGRKTCNTCCDGRGRNTGASGTKILRKHAQRAHQAVASTRSSPGCGCWTIDMQIPLFRCTTIARHRVRNSRDSRGSSERADYRVHPLKSRTDCVAWQFRRLQPDIAVQVLRDLVTACQRGNRLAHVGDCVPVCSRTI